MDNAKRKKIQETLDSILKDYQDEMKSVISTSNASEDAKTLAYQSTTQTFYLARRVSNALLDALE